MNRRGFLAGGAAAVAAVALPQTGGGEAAKYVFPNHAVYPWQVGDWLEVGSHGYNDSFFGQIAEVREEEDGLEIVAVEVSRSPDPGTEIRFKIPRPT